MFRDPLYHYIMGKPTHKGLVMGAEFELEATNHFPAIETLQEKKLNFARHEDNSLRNRGVEFITNIPTDPFTLVSDYRKLKEEIRITHTKILEDSPRISTHLHINFLDRSLKEIINFIATCYILEDFIISYAGDKRISNQFCLSVKDAEYQLENFATLISQQIPQLSNEGTFKYSNINLCSIPTKGTVEIRSLKGYPDVDHFNHWVHIFADIYRKCCSPNFNVQQDLMRAISQASPFVWFKDTFPHFFALMIANGMTEEQINQAIFSNLRNIQYLLNRFSIALEKEELLIQQGKEVPQSKKKTTTTPPFPLRRLRIQDPMQLNPAQEARIQERVDALARELIQADEDDGA